MLQLSQILVLSQPDFLQRQLVSILAGWSFDGGTSE
jgi:hypothetical protein